MTTALLQRREKVHRLLYQAARDGQTHKVNQASYLLRMIDLRMYLITKSG